MHDEPRTQIDAAENQMEAALDGDPLTGTANAVRAVMGAVRALQAELEDVRSRIEDLERPTP